MITSANSDDDCQPIALWIVCMLSAHACSLLRIVFMLSDVVIVRAWGLNITRQLLYLVIVAQNSAACVS